MKRIFAFANERDFQNAKYAGERIRAQNNSPKMVHNQKQSRPLYAKITDLVAGTDDKEAKAVEVVFNKTSREYEVPSPARWTFDSGALENNLTTTNIFSHLALKKNEVVEVRQVPNVDNEESVNLAVKSSPGGSSTVLLNLKSFSSGVYTADIITSPTDSTVLEADVKVKLHEGASNESTLVGEEVFSTASYTETIDSQEVTVYYFDHPTIK